ncbi:hypothetical protein PRIPAC_84371 [Pristionchus pacificus]|uniref:BTB domain-containing protein n=1 Tax=Pristionchus pacificus TaxID=54126 RepID=A0A2A6BLA4_PRIPA|nr:hypothetical protein PRIPAC_84371 [Pristionchus pacificus]|eukprot:PDM66694.1 BTB domain-containing protein [Pristionchus pacificus]
MIDMVLHGGSHIIGQSSSSFPSFLHSTVEQSYRTDVLERGNHPRRSPRPTSHPHRSMETPPQEPASPEKKSEKSTSDYRSLAHIVPTPLPLAALLSASPQTIQLVIQTAHRLRMSSKSHNVRDLFDTIQREHASVQSKMMAQQSELEKTRQEMQMASQQVMQMSMGIQQAQMEAAKHRHIAETSVQLLQKLIPVLPNEYAARVTKELERFNGERQMAAAAAAGFPGMGGQQMQQMQQMQQLQAAMANPLLAMNPAMAALMGQQQAAAAAAMMQQQHHHQQQAAAQQQAHAALAALQQQAAMGQAMGQMGQMGAAQQQQLKMMMAAMGMPQAMQPPTSSAAPSGLSQINPAGLASPAARSLALPSTPASPFAAPNGTMGSSAAASAAKSRKRSSPSTPRAGDTPEVGGGPVPPINPSLALSLATSASSSRSASPSVSIPTSAAAAATPAAAASTPTVDPAAMLLQMQQGPSSSSSIHSTSSTGSASSAAAAAPPPTSSASSPIHGISPEALNQMMQMQPQMASLLTSLMFTESFDYERNGDFEAKLNVGIFNQNDESLWQKLGEVGGFLWNARAKYGEANGNKFVTTFHIVLTVDRADNDRWSYDVDITASLLSNNSKPINLILIPNKENKDYPIEHCWIETCAWPEVTHKECFDVGANTVTVSFKIQIVKSSGANPRRVIEFGSEIDHLNDVKLIVEGQAIAVSKNYLAMHSPFFNSLFYREFVEKDKKEIEMPDVKYEDAINLLEIIYPSHCKITASNMEGVVLLSDVWDISIVRRKCDKFLAADVVPLNSTVVQKVPLAKKVLYASRYALPMLQHALLIAFDKKRMIEVMDSAEYKEMCNFIAAIYRLHKIHFKVKVSSTTSIDRFYLI